MTIGYITRNYPPQIEGGAEISLWLLANALAKRGIKVRVFVPNDQSRKYIIDGTNPKIYRFPWEKKRPFTLNNPVAQQKFRNSILHTKEKLDLIDAYNFITALPAVSLDLGIPYVVSVRDATPLCDVRSQLTPSYHSLHGYFKNRFKYLGFSPMQALFGIFGYALTEKRLQVIRGANYVMYASRALANLFEKFNPNFDVVYSIAQSHEKYPKNYSIKGIDFAKDKVFIYAGRLAYGKGAKFLFDCAEQIVSQRKDIKFIFVGRGEYQKELENTPYKKNIFTLGKQEHKNVLSLMAKSRAIIVPSIIFEPFPRAALESLSLNTPVIGTNSGGIPEAVGNAGIIVDITKDALIKAIIDLSDNNDLYKKLKNRAKAQISKFSEEKIVNKIISIYESVLK